MHRTEFDGDWFPAEVTATAAGPPIAYSFKEKHLLGDQSFADKIGGRVGTTLNPAVAIVGGPFSIGDIVLVRAAKGAGGLYWEAVPLGECCWNGADRFLANGNLVSGPVGSGGTGGSISVAAGASANTTGSLAAYQVVATTVGGATDVFLVEGQATVVALIGAGGGTLPDVVHLDLQVWLDELAAGADVPVGSSGYAKCLAAQRHAALASGSSLGFTGDVYSGNGGLGVFLGTGQVKVRVVGGGRRFCLGVGGHLQSSNSPSAWGASWQVVFGGWGGSWVLATKLCCPLDFTPAPARVPPPGKGIGKLTPQQAPAPDDDDDDDETPAKLSPFTGVGGTPATGPSGF